MIKDQKMLLYTKACAMSQALGAVVWLSVQLQLRAGINLWSAGTISMALSKSPMKAQNDPSAANRRKWCSELFHAYDKDKSGAIDVEEFLVIMQAMDDSVQMADVEQTFRMVGAKESLDKEQFWEWCVNLFGDLDDYEFTEQMQDLILASGDPV